MRDDCKSDYGERWVSANVVYNEQQYIYEILRAPFPTKLGIYSGRIVQLYLYDEADQAIAEYDRQWILGPDKGTDAYHIVGKILKEYNYQRKGYEPRERYV